MKPGKDLYTSKNWLFWIYEYEGCYYLIDTLPYLPLIFFGFYRSVIFKMKAKRISEEEAISYRYKNKSKSSVTLTLGGAGAAGFSLISANIIRSVKKINLFFSVKAYVILIFSFYLMFLILLSCYRRKYGFYKLKYKDAKIKVKTKDKKIFTKILYHIVNLIYLMILLEPFTRLQKVLIAGGINAVDMLTVVSSMILTVLFLIMPMNMLHGDLTVIDMKKK